MTRLALLVLAGQALVPAPVTLPQPPGVSRAAVVALEQSFDGKIKTAVAADPMDMLCNTQGVYLVGYGAVFTSQVDLIVTPMPNAFQPLNKALVEKVHARKLAHLPLLRQAMKKMLVEAAAAMTTMPPGEQVVVAVSLLRLSWEDSTGLPNQILMRASRQQLLDKAAESAIQVQEF